MEPDEIFSHYLWIKNILRGWLYNFTFVTVNDPVPVCPGRFCQPLFLFSRQFPFLNPGMLKFIP